MNIARAVNELGIAVEVAETGVCSTKYLLAGDEKVSRIATQGIMKLGCMEEKGL